MVFLTKITTILSTLLMINACTHTASIEFVDQYHIAQIPDYSHLPSYYKSHLVNSLNKNHLEGFQCLMFSSDSDLGNIVRKGNMKVISYKLSICGEADPFEIGPIFPTHVTAEQSLYYVAYWPENLLEYEMHFLHTSKEDLLAALQKHGACLSVTAGAMGGDQLRSNQIRVDFP